MGKKGEGGLPRENSVRSGQAKKRERSFQVEETIHAKALGKYLKNLGTKKNARVSAEKEKCYRKRLKRETEDKFLQQIL